MKRILSLIMIIFMFAVIGCDTQTNGSQPITKPKYFTVILNANNGTDQTTDITVEIKNNKIKWNVSGCPFESVNGQTFLHWNDESDDSGTIYDVSEDITLSAKIGSITLYAVWKAAPKGQYYVEFDANNGKDQSTDRMVFLIDQKKNLKTIADCRFGAPAKNMRFAGWNTKADGSGKSYTDGERVQNLTSANNTIVLYAQWVLREYFIITFYDDKNVSNPNDTTFDMTQDVTLTDLSGVSGYTFVGWWNAQAGGTKMTGWNAGDVTDDIKLYARWNANNYTVTFNKNADDAVGTMTNQDMTYDMTTALKANTFSRSGFRFVGWNTAADGNGMPFANEQTVSNLTSVPNGVVTLYAVWEEADTYTIAFNANGGDGTMDSITVVIDEDYTLPKCTFKAPTGKVFDKWTVQSNGTGTSYENMATVNGLAAKEQTITLYAQWKFKDYYVITLHDELHPDTADVTFDTTNPAVLPTPSETGWTFGGWWTEADGGEQITSWTTYDDTELYARWTPNVITYTFKANGGKWNDDTTADKYVTGDYGTAVNVPVNPTRKGWSFTGWNGAVLTTYDVTDETFTAQWTAIWDTDAETGNIIYGDTVYDKTSFVKVMNEAVTIVGSSSYNSSFINKRDREDYLEGVFLQGRTVKLSPYHIGQYEVTQELFHAVMNNDMDIYSNNSNDDGKHPAYKVSWYDAITFCNKLSFFMGKTPCYSVNGITDWAALEYSSIPTDSTTDWDVAVNMSADGYRLPTEAEWEFAARGGSTGSTHWVFAYAGKQSSKAIYYGNDDSSSYQGGYLESDDNLKSVGWYRYSSNTKVHPVGTKTANLLNLYDMSGNLVEWCWDIEGNVTSNDATYLVDGVVTNPLGGASGTERVYRGGSYNVPAYQCAVTIRYGIRPDYRSSSFGFRLAKSVTE